MAEGVQSRIRFESGQVGNYVDFDNIGRLSIDADDAIGRDVVGTDNAWTEMSVLQEGATSVRVQLGRIWRDGKFYGNPDAESDVLSLATVVPTSTKKIVTIVGTGAEVGHASQPRTIENAQTGARTTTQKDTQTLRKLTVSYVAGSESATPQAPFTEPNYVPIANVTLSTSGVETIDLLEGFRLDGLQNHDTRLVSLESFRRTIGTRVETLASDLVSVKGDIDRINVPIINENARQVAEFRELLGRDDTALLTGYDWYLTEDESDAANVDYSARIEEGLRFPWAATKDVTPQPFNPGEPRLQQRSGWSLPSFTEKRRLDAWGQFTSVSVSTYQYANTSFTIYPGAKRRRRWGPSRVVSQNSAFWQKAQYTANYVTEMFKLAGETYQITDQWREDGVSYYRVQQYFDDAINYWSEYGGTRTISASNGYLVAQTFLNAQAGWMTSLGLRFGKVDPSYGMDVFVVQTKGGEPDVNQVIAQGSIAAGEAVASTAPGAGNENRVTLTPVFLKPGERYAIVLVTGGDYAVAATFNDISSGTFFVGDGTNAWAADLGKDMSLRLYYAEFDSPYAAVQLQTVTLAGGMTDLDVLTTEMVPEGAELYWLVRPDGNTSYRRLEKVEGTHPLASGPQTVEVQIVMIGTREVMPGIKLAESALQLQRSDDAFTHISTERDAGATAGSVEVELELVNWDQAKHTLTATIEAAGNSDGPDSTTDRTRSDGVLERRMSFSLTSPSQTYAIKLVGASTDSVDSFLVSSRYDKAAA